MVCLFGEASLKEEKFLEWFLGKQSGRDKSGSEGSFDGISTEEESDEETDITEEEPPSSDEKRSDLSLGTPHLSFIRHQIHESILKLNVFLPSTFPSRPNVSLYR